ncbi:unnamed protein product [Strongylus vulgaris]|uniref:Peptidase M12A domain-containing protein n=1 Tax=Strongylus vulgaris TaxID=40348 RepID=A0A3P7LJR9_STRVU|nr:unnamed protein product [Strongylus vulgaris]
MELAFSDAHKKEITKIALNYLQARTCVTFTESATAPNRVGITAHEFAHTLGAYHIQQRDDRDDYITVDLTNVPPDMRGNFVKMDPSESIDYVPYEYGSYMHYGSNTSSNAHKKEITKIALNYLQARTCVTFTESATAPNRVGITAHEFAHTLGAYHIQQRDDRDDYITVDLTNVPPDMRGNFVKMDPSESIDYVPYEYGSYMHYGSNT